MLAEFDDTKIGVTKLVEVKVAENKLVYVFIANAVSEPTNDAATNCNNCI